MGLASNTGWNSVKAINSHCDAMLWAGFCQWNVQYSPSQGDAWTHNQARTHSDIPASCIGMTLGCGRKLEYLERTGRFMQTPCRKAPDRDLLAQIVSAAIIPPSDDSQCISIGFLCFSTCLPRNTFPPMISTTQLLWLIKPAKEREENVPNTILMSLQIHFNFQTLQGRVRNKYFYKIMNVGVSRQTCNLLAFLFKATCSFICDDNDLRRDSDRFKLLSLTLECSDKSNKMTDEEIHLKSCRLSGTGKVLIGRKRQEVLLTRRACAEGRIGILINMWEASSMFNKPPSSFKRLEAFSDGIWNMVSFRTITNYFCLTHTIDVCRKVKEFSGWNFLRLSLV